MPQQGYARIIFTASIASYVTERRIRRRLFDTYTSGKVALRIYATIWTRSSRRGIEHAGFDGDPYAMNTRSPSISRPITRSSQRQPACPTPILYSTSLYALRQLLANGLPPSWWAIPTPSC